MIKAKGERLLRVNSSTLVFLCKIMELANMKHLLLGLFALLLVPFSFSEEEEVIEEVVVTGSRLGVTEQSSTSPVSYTHLTLPTKRIV